jgi:hypothetical protein
MRQQHQLTPHEQRKFARLRPFQGEALAFWSYVARVRGLDPTTVISNGLNFTALPSGHGKHWCYPTKLKCSKKPVYVEL